MSFEEVLRDIWELRSKLQNINKDLTNLEFAVNDLWKKTPNCDDCEERMPDEPMRDESRE